MMQENFRAQARPTGQPAVIKQCKNCGADFKAKACQAHHRFYCSHKCKGEGRTKAALREKICPNCSKPFLIQPSRGVRYCSPACSNAGMRKKKTKGTWHIQGKNGYYATTRQGRTVLQHRDIMEKHLGRPLKPFENVHHKNGVRTDNSIHNLEIWIVKQPKGQRPEDLIEWAIAFLEFHGWKVSKP